MPSPLVSPPIPTSIDKIVLILHELFLFPLLHKKAPNLIYHYSWIRLTTYIYTSLHHQFILCRCEIFYNSFFLCWNLIQNHVYIYYVRDVIWWHFKIMCVYIYITSMQIHDFRTRILIKKCSQASSPTTCCFWCLDHSR